MIKKVRVDDLQVGVYVHDYNCTGDTGNIYIDPGAIKRESTIKIQHCPVRFLHEQFPGFVDSACQADRVAFVIH